MRQSGLQAEPRRIDVRIGAVVSVLVVAILSLWNAASLIEDNSFKYVLYTLPPLIILCFVYFSRGKIDIHTNGVYALLIYLFVSSISILYNYAVGWYSLRDLFIISSYIVIFCLFFRAPRFVADALLVFCIVGTLTVLSIRGLSIDTGLTHPHGQQLLESVVSFPAGIVLLYYISERKWGRGLIAFVLFVLAFKRIAFLGVGAALCLEMTVYVLLRRPVGPVVSTVIVAMISVVALFSLQIFDLMATLLNEENVSANSVSLGRADIAAELWRQIQSADIGRILMGFGPGGADKHLFESGSQLNPHNDWLKILFDYGLIGFVGLHAVLRLLFPNTPLGNKLYLYTAILMMTGNPLIYTYYFVSLFLVVRIPARRPTELPSFPEAAAIAPLPNPNNRSGLM